MSLPTVTIVGDVVKEPTLTYPSPNNPNFCKTVLSIVCSKTIYNRETQQYTNRDSIYFVEVYGAMAKNIVEKKTFFPGFIVKITAELESSSYQDSSGNNKYFTKMVLNDYKNMEVLYRKPGSIEKWNIARGKIHLTSNPINTPHQLPLEEPSNVITLCNNQTTVPEDEEIPF